jgi:hypothetical protein
MEDQTPRFVNDGIWENGYDDRHLNLVRSMQPGDKIAIKSSYTRKHNLPFDNRGNTVSVIAIKANRQGHQGPANWAASACLCQSAHVNVPEHVSGHPRPMHSSKSRSNKPKQLF